MATEQQIYLDPVAAGSPVTNNTGSQIEYQYSASVTESSSIAWATSVQVKAGTLGKIKDLFSVQISQTYSHSTTETHTWTDTIKVPIPAGETAYIYCGAPAYRDSGTMTVTVGNTTWQLVGVTLDSPNPNGTGQYIVTNEPLL